MSSPATLYRRTAASSSLKPQASSFSPPRKRSAFTLIELLIVIAIIAILAGLGFTGISGALKSARKNEVRAMANQIKLGLSAYYAEYGTYPRVTNSGAEFLAIMAPTTTNASNRRGIRFLDVPDKFTNSLGIVTPRNFYPDERQTNYNIKVDTNYDGRLILDLPSGRTNIGGSAAVWVDDPDDTNKVIGTW